MSAVDDILRSLPIDQLAQEVGADPQQVEQAAQTALPALLGGLQANAQDPGGANSILEALGQHDDQLLEGGVDLAQVDTGDGEKIASHIFGSQEDQVYSALGGAGGNDSLIRRLIPILAPIVLSYLANKVLKGGGGLGGGTTHQAPAPTGQGGQQGGPGSLDQMLQDVLGGALGAGSAQQAPAPQQQTQSPSGGSIIDILGGLLGGGRR